MNETTEQQVHITLAEYMEYQELKEHEKMVKLTEEVKGVDFDYHGHSVNWKSDGAVWTSLTSKLNRAGLRMKELQQEIETLKGDDVKSLKKHIKELEKMNDSLAKQNDRLIEKNHDLLQPPKPGIFSKIFLKTS